MRGWRALALVSIAALLSSGGGAGAAELAPHQALYALTRGAGGSSSVDVHVDGFMTYRAEKTCDGWILTQSVRGTLTAPDSAMPPLKLDSTYAGFESMDGSAFRFVFNGNVFGKTLRIKGKASVSEDGGSVVYARPLGRTEALPAGTLFPIGFTRAIVARAESGEGMVSFPLFSGAELTGTSFVTVFVGKEAEPAEGSDELARARGWAMRLAFFPVEGSQETPLRESDALTLENGVSPQFTEDYGLFVIRAELRKIEAVAQPECP